MQPRQQTLSHNNSYSGPSLPKQQISLKEPERANFEAPKSPYLSNIPSKELGSNNLAMRDRNDKLNKSVEYHTIDHDRRRFDTGSNRGQNDDSYDPFINAGNRKQTTRQQRLNIKMGQNETPQNEQLQRDYSNANIYFPGDAKITQETREKRPDFAVFRRPNRSNNNKSMIEYNPNIDDSPKIREIRIKEALNDHSRDSVEQSRYFSRLEKSNRRQKALFADHYKKYIIPSTMKIHEKLNRDQDRMLDAKKRMEQLEIEQDK